MTTTDTPQQYDSISKYDRLYGGSKLVGLMTKPSTVKNVEAVTGRTETWIVQTARHEDGDRIYIECVDENSQVTRLALPPKVAKAIESQRDSLTTTHRRRISKAAAKSRMERGELPAFLKKKRG